VLYRSHLLSKVILPLACGGLFLAAAAHAQETTTVRSVAQQSTSRDKVQLLPTANVQINGLLGERMKANLEGRLLTIDENHLLDGFRKRPGHHPWIGEHVGKWLHAASMAWMTSGDARLREKMDRVAGELVRTQESDGYLGTYASGHRMGYFGDDAWDVWVHKYAILGLVSYHNCTGSTEALAAAKRAADFVLGSFPPGGADINKTSMHVGMASTSIIEPMVLLARATGDERYLQFAEQMVAAWDTPTGAQVVSKLLDKKTVLEVGNRKAYEMLSCLVGLCELYRGTGNAKYLETAQIAWEDVRDHQLFLTGSGSVDERWTHERPIPHGERDKVAETCVTVTWMQLGLQLFRLTGESHYMDELERSIYNHLLGAQRPAGNEFCYYTPLEGPKPYSRDMTCCFSSGARGLAMIPSLAYSVSQPREGGEALQVNLFADGEATVRLPSGREIKLTQSTSYPLNNQVQINVEPTQGSHTFPLQLRIPAWSREAEFRVAGGEWNLAAPRGWCSILREWRAGDTVELRFTSGVRAVEADYLSTNSVALMYGPLVLAADEQCNKPRNMDALRQLAVFTKDPALEKLEPKAPGNLFQLNATGPDKAAAELTLVPFYAAGINGGQVRVLFPKTDTAPH